MELKPGYKQTEVGVIPEDWDVEPLVRVCEPKGIVRGPFGGALKKEIFVATGFKVYEQKNAIYKSCAAGSYFIDQPKYSEMQRFSVAPGDFIVSCSGTIGCIYMLPCDAPEGVINQALLKLRVNGDVAMPGFFYIYFGWDDFQAKIIDSTQGGAMKNLVGMSIFKNTPIVLPPRPEQNAIASALGDMNALLSSLEQLLAKKQEIKQAAMQELLTGKRRLPGFEGEWVVKKLGDHVRFFRNGVNSRAELQPEGRIRYLHYGDIHACCDSFLSPEQLASLPADKAAGLDRLQNGDLIFADASEDIAGVSRSVELCGISDYEAVSGLHTIAARFDNAVLADGFKGYLQYVPSFSAHLRRLAAGTKVYATNRAHISSAEVRFPPVAEQKAIAEVLIDMSNEIGVLRERMYKACSTKQGMMQQLLTGKIRLT